MSFAMEVFLVLLWLSLIWWTYQDVRRRTENATFITVALAVVIVLPFFGAIIYLIVRPPELMDEARERELELIALERRLHEIGDEEGRQMVSRMISREGFAGGEIEAGDILRRAGAVTQDDLRDLQSRLTELEFRLRVTDRVNRESAPAAAGPFDQAGETGRGRVRPTTPGTGTTSGGID